MNEVINIIISQTELFFIIIGSSCWLGAIYWWINNHIKSVTKDYEFGLLSMVCDDVQSKLDGVNGEGIEPIISMSAQQARQRKEDSVDKESLVALLKPVYDKISQASDRGYGEIFLSGRDWYYNKNEKYMKATEELTGLGYQVWKDRGGFGVWVKW